ncbi:MAG: hypothetical protein WKF84_28675 [Pyrinomonadaceae bacterium]
MIDSVGRNPHDLADQMELADYLRGCSDLAKCLVLQATTHPVDALAAVNQFALFGSDHLVLSQAGRKPPGQAPPSPLPPSPVCRSPIFATGSACPRISSSPLRTLTHAA